LPTSNSSAILYAGFPESNNLIASTFSFSVKSFTFRITGSHHVNFTWQLRKLCSLNSHSHRARFIYWSRSTRLGFIYLFSNFRFDF
jgi:hypothetical protein